jgi:Glutamine amidotransferase domain
MCGIGGFGGIPIAKRQVLTLALGLGIDRRGGHSSGYLSIQHSGALERGRTTDTWSTADAGFHKSAWQGNLVAMHARYATCGSHSKTNAHPFKVQRKRKTVLWGMHNGIIWDAHGSAKKNGRDYTVDSLELLELLADREYDQIAGLSGYGTIVWVEAGDTKHVKICRMTENADMHIARNTEGHGTIYGSTAGIVNESAAHAGVTIEPPWEPDHGVVYQISTNGLVERTEEIITLEPARVYTHKRFRSYSRDMFQNSKTMVDYITEDEEREWLAMEEASAKKKEQNAPSETQGEHKALSELGFSRDANGVWRHAELEESAIDPDSPDAEEVAESLGLNMEETRAWINGSWQE